MWSASSSPSSPKLWWCSEPATPCRRSEMRSCRNLRCEVSPSLSRGHQRTSILCPPLVNRDRMSNNSRRRLRSIPWPHQQKLYAQASRIIHSRKLRPRHPGRLKLRHTVDTIEQADKLDPTDRSAECLPELLHEFECFLLFLLLFLGLVGSHLPVLVNRLILRRCTQMLTTRRMSSRLFKGQ